MNKEAGVQFCEALLKAFQEGGVSSKTEVYSAITALYWAEVVSTDEHNEFLTRLGWGM